MEKKAEYKRQPVTMEHVRIRNGMEVHSEEITDIIGTPPNALVRWGTTWVIVVLIVIVMLTTFIRYPDLVRAPLRINAANAPKAVVTRISGNIVNVLVEAGGTVAPAQPLAWMESTAEHGQVLDLLDRLKILRDSLLTRFTTSDPSIIAPAGIQLGELQGSYQTFYQSYLTYQAALRDGIYLKRKTYILNELKYIELQKEQLGRQQELQEEEFALAEKEFNRYKELADRKIISPSEYQRQQALLLTKKHPLQQIASALLDNDVRRTAKMRELSDLDNQIAEEKLKFAQALNSLVSEMEEWKKQHVLTAPQAGTLVYAGIIQRNQYVDAGQEMFYVNPGSSEFFGEINVPQYNMGKIRIGQQVLIKLDSYPFEEYGVLRGRIAQLNRVPYRDSVFLSRVDVLPSKTLGIFELTTGMVGTAEIITEDVSLLQRLVRNVRLMIDKRN
ncbi:HlyD family secretion protein [Parapedobacter indicus]|uniref:HlyD family secretion protein n=1 Tax=Parapedobacter indicus TaxID=1477437 RepID=A0A1I3HT37_9SPHI|nr:HlyD family efflux transporter periplasmic adaptor subunit [Parapedobacter indicus]PPL03158.1 HlyD family secretion protein [Parapedobacter indicus]SFI38904.1 HlyD family secretion protein [Parapedobacter indicus]